MSDQPTTLPGLSSEELPAPSVRYVTVRELTTRLAKLYARHPELEVFEARMRAEEECPCCVRADVGTRFGWDVADELDDVRFLLGIDR